MLTDVKLQKRTRRALQNDILRQKVTNDVTRTASTAAGISSTTKTTTTPGPKPAPTTAVLILTYQRSGSSLIGELFNQNPSAFYLFEPLWALYENKINPTFPSTLLLANGNKRPMPATEDFGSFSQELITNMARCDLGQVPMEILAPFGDDGHWFFSANGRHKALAKYIDCIKKDNDAKKDALCVPLAQAVCDNSTIRAIKTIRFRMWMLERVLLENPGMKVIHLFRDPRASILSRFTSTQAGCKLEFEASARCYDMSKDLTTGGHLFKKYPGRIMRILYEDMADYPMETAQKIHMFLGKELPKNVLDWVLENTAAGVNDTELFETTRANSSETAHAWELSIPTDMAFKIDEICYDVIEELGIGILPLVQKKGRWCIFQNHVAWATIEVALQSEAILKNHEDE
ncbi:carbohydrate sulfotransferase 1-like [Lingula anatina]|uniref:Carbohydrate sulfotransferase 1-like n=1 Tax=Lingula anatina TaxID=7574 RepID=A0A1S3IE47_LINAN|nr:carbohydrate sulfotransferase 1-like [Lingula anatina]|eukprot:XP_013395729.1 carbohydrate sulfotransferase 1-like [Lingula anatina]